MATAIITSVYGDYDAVHDLPEEHGFDEAVCVTDGKSRIGKGWTVRVEERQQHPRLAAKHPKMTPWNYTDCDSAVWLDASFTVLTPKFNLFVRDHLVENDFVVWLHPEGRIDFAKEAAVCQDWEKYRDYDIRGQVNSYIAQGMPSDWGLFACGTIGYRFTDEVKALGEEWLREQYDWSIQDQVSLPYLLWKNGKAFGLWRANEYDNPFVRLHWQDRKKPNQ